MCFCAVVCDAAITSVIEATPPEEVVCRAFKQMFDCLFISCSARDLLASACSSFEQCVLDVLPISCTVIPLPAQIRRRL